MSFGFIFGALFFLLLFFAAITSAVAMIEVLVATFIDLYGFERKKAALLVLFIVILIGLPSALSYTPLKLELFATPILDVNDFAFGTIGIIAAGFVLSVIAGWFIDKNVILKEIGGGRRMQRLFMLTIKIIIPLVLFINLITRVINFK